MSPAAPEHSIPRVLPFRRLAGAACVALAAFRTAAAQQEATPAPQVEFRAEGVLSPRAGALLGVGLNVRAGWYARVGLAAMAGASDGRAGTAGVQRLEGTARFLFDPFGERRRGLYAGAGLGVERVNGAGTAQARGLLLGVVGVEGGTVGRVVPALELTVGGGVRLGVLLRTRRPQGR